MVKKYQVVLGALLLVSGSRAYTEEVSYDRLYTAIDTTNVEMMQRIVKQLKPIPALKKKQLLEASQDVIEEKEKNVSLLKSPRDVAKLGAGISISALGIAIARYGIQKALKTKKKIDTSFARRDNWYEKDGYPDDRTKLIKKASIGVFGALTGAAGLYVAVKGLRCSTAVGRCKEAEAIEALIKNLKVSPE